VGDLCESALHLSLAVLATPPPNPAKLVRRGNSDGRWSKRFTWPDELHRDFVSAVFDVGLKHSSPSAILSQMPEHEGITTERIKSHLQKYRVHRAKSKSEFMGCLRSIVEQVSHDGGQVALNHLRPGKWQLMPLMP
jgi:SHAQKYF class myb-like DNA-binding protein